MMDTNSKLKVSGDIPRPIRWGVLGPAKTAIKRFFPAISAVSPEQKVVAIAAGRKERGLEKAAAFFSDYAETPRKFVGDSRFEQLIENPDVDAVYIPLPTALHAEWTIKALEARKHVLCEKPMALSIEELDGIYNAQATSGCIVEENFSYYLSPLFEYIDTKAIPEIIKEAGSINVHFSFLATKEHEIRFFKDLGGGSFFDIGCYGIDIAHRLLKENIETLQVAVEPPKGHMRYWGSGPKDPVDAECVLTAKSTSGVDVIIRTSFCSQRQQSVLISSESGSCLIPTAFHLSSENPAHTILSTSENAQNKQFSPFNQHIAILESFRKKAKGLNGVSEEQWKHWRRNTHLLESAGEIVFKQLGLSVS
ncbi:MAG: Gfo/Idh/MocA family oxidoreductase [Deltaproteobacteria bacterium]|nr:Gfo/Idh/MocA family oxidoreductase [Deltaproteobacteria bacterium]